MGRIPRHRNTDPDSVIAFSFGRRSEPHLPADSNADLAREVVRRYSTLPVVAQSEIASLLPTDMVRLCIASTGPQRYLDTHEVALRALHCLSEDNLSRPVVVAHPAHLYRALASCRRLGLDAREPDGELRVRFDRHSTQWWTRGPIRWWLRELPTTLYYRRRLAAAARGDKPGSVTGGGADGNRRNHLTRRSRQRPARLNVRPSFARLRQTHGFRPRSIYILGVSVVLAIVVLVSRAFLASSPSSVDRFVHVCGSRLCLAGRVFIVHGATAYRAYDSPAAEVALAKRTNLNVLELLEFDTKFHALSDVESPATWLRVDHFITAAAAARLHVILNLSEYGQSLQAARISPTTVDWGGYLRFIADRRNTVTGILYKNDPTIAMVELFGEITPPHDGSDPGAAGTTDQIRSFFRRTLAEWKALAPNILVSTGGFSYLDDPASGLNWRDIVRDPNDATCDAEVNSLNDLRIGVALISSFCKRLGKPWFLAAWSACYGDPTRGYDYSSSDQSMAQHARAMFLVGRGGAPAATPSIGGDFWNLADTPAVSGTCNIGPSFPLTLAAVRAGLP